MAHITSKKDSDDEEYDKEKQDKLTTASKTDFHKFVHALTLSWLELKESNERKLKALIDPVALHLKEMAASTESGSTFVAFMTSQMSSLTELLKQVRNIEEETGNTEKEIET